MRRLAVLSVVAALVLAGLVLPRVDLWASTPAPVPPEIHTMPLRGVDKKADAPAVPDGQRVVVLTDRRSVPEYALLGVTWQGKASEDVSVKVRTHTDGAWSPWTALEVDSDDRPAAQASRGKKGRRFGTAPFYAGDSDGVQVMVAAPKGPKPRDLQLDLIDPGESDHDDEVGQSPAEAAHATADQPRFISRIEWGADETIMDWDPEYSATIQAGFVHHTVNANDYTRDEAPGIVRAIYAYHAESKGWGDIGYNFLVDRFGRVYEGRYGGVDRPVIAGHAYRFNENTFGVSGIGDFSDAAPSSAMVDAIGDVLAWKLERHGRDPFGTTVLNGQTVDVIAGHRDVGATECPGRLLYGELGELRSAAAADMSADEQVFTGDWDGDGVATAGKFDQGRWVLRDDNADPGSEVTVTFGGPSDTPVVGDFNGDGRTTVGTYSDGRWSLKLGGPDSLTTLDFRFGGPSDTPVVGDWDGDGRDEPGVFSDGQWRLKNAVGGGAAADRTFGFGQAGDRPFFGDWDGDGTDTPGLRRGSQWHLSPSLEGGTGTQFSYGEPGDRPVVGRWDSDAASEIGVVRGMGWYLRDDLSSGPATQTFRM